ncbi:hypothetical protein GB931_11250 [Modestobacter sp. I12A-02628]|uniref:PknH-like extracellular domain-containing protein n=1 Tax=Goekera deserti TaxID=2497753 RepID=A0A7K3WEE3_9ACTN|nr:hypothetical protein [Goekera deserti]MPQ98482.1 hypothetical protein [Goekera deserti]NDI48311.1 hypothetical protein [Goekera deserti]NEL54060.1 hypothetical protein [Goekera deserti]
MTTRPTRALTAAAATAMLLLAGCGGGDAPDPADATAASTSAVPDGPTAAATPTAVEPSVAAAEASAAAAADPAAATDPAGAALASALRAADLPAGWSVQANPVVAGDLGQSLAGICGYAFTSEDRRTAKYPVVGVDPSGAAGITSEAIAYDSPESASLALTELAAAFQGCPPEDYTFVQTPPADGLAPQNFRVAYQLSTGFLQVVVGQARGSVLSVLIGSDQAAVLAAGGSIAQRLALLPAAAVGG